MDFNSKYITDDPLAWGQQKFMQGKLSEHLLAQWLVHLWKNGWSSMDGVDVGYQFGILIGN